MTAEVPRGRGAHARTASSLRLVWVYPDLLSTYGDRGNLLIGVDLGDLDREAAQPGPPGEHDQVPPVAVGAQQIRVDPDQPDGRRPPAARTRAVAALAHQFLPQPMRPRAARICWNAV